MGDVWNYSAASTSVAAVSMNPLEATEPSLNNQLSVSVLIPTALMLIQNWFGFMIFYVYADCKILS